MELPAVPRSTLFTDSFAGQLNGLTGSQRAALSLVQKTGTCLFVTDKDAYLVQSPEEILDLTTGGQLAFTFMIDVEKSLRPVVETIAIYKKRKSRNWKRNEALLNQLCEAAGL